MPFNASSNGATKKVSQFIGPCNSSPVMRVILPIHSLYDIRIGMRVHLGRDQIQKAAMC